MRLRHPGQRGVASLWGSFLRGLWVRAGVVLENTANGRRGARSAPARTGGRFRAEICAGPVQPDRQKVCGRRRLPGGFAVAMRKQQGDDPEMGECYENPMERFVQAMVAVKTDTPQARVRTGGARPKAGSQAGTRMTCQV